MLLEEIVAFIKYSEKSINQLQAVIEHNLKDLRVKVAKFFCEDIFQFKLEECLRIFVSFEQRFKMAVEENRKRQENLLKIKSRQSNNKTFSESPNTAADKTMCRSFELNNLVPETNNDDGLLKSRRSRPSSQDIADVHSNLVEFLSGSTSNDTVNLDRNVFGTNFRRVGSGRRSFRSISTDNERERVSTSLEDNNDCAEPFNRFSPFRRTLNYRSYREPKRSLSNYHKENESKQNQQSTSPTTTLSKEEDNQELISKQETAENKPNHSSPKLFPFDLKKKNPLNNYVQHLTAIISPSKIIENNDEIHRNFGPQEVNKDSNIIISTITKERPSTLSPSTLPLIQRRSSSFILSPDGKSTPPNAAIVIPLQKVTESEQHQNQANPIDEKPILNNEIIKCKVSIRKIETKPEKIITKSLKSKTTKPTAESQAPSKLPSLAARKSTNSTQNSTTGNCSKANSIPQRQLSARSSKGTNKTSSLNSSIPVVQRSKSYYRTPSTISRTNLTSDQGSLHSLKRLSQLGTISTTTKSQSVRNPKSFMKPTSASVARSRLTKPQKNNITVK